MLHTLAISKRTPAFILNWLSYHGDWEVRYWVADNPNTLPKTLERLSYDEKSGVRSEVARNPNTSQEILDRLSYDKNCYVRLGVTCNPTKNNPLKMDVFKFFDWLETASISDLESLTTS